MAQHTPSQLALPRNTPFPWDRLPAELQLHILQYTELIRKPQESANFQDDPLGYTMLDGIRPFASPSFYFNRSDFHSSTREWYQKLPESGKPGEIRGSLSCDDPFEIARFVKPRIPRDLFLVSRTMRSQATEVLYSCNQFQIQGEGSMVLELLERMPERRLRLIKNLTLYLEEFGEGPELIGTPSLAREILELLKTRGHPMVKLRIVHSGFKIPETVLDWCRIAKAFHFKEFSILYQNDEFTERDGRLVCV